MPGSGNPAGYTFPLAVRGRPQHVSASLERYTDQCPSCALPYTVRDDRRFEYPYRQLLAEFSPRDFLTWSDAQNNGYISYSLMRASSCSVEGREDAAEFTDYIRERIGDSAPQVVLDLGCGPQAAPAYIAAVPDAELIGLDPFDSEWAGRFIQGAGEFLPLPDHSVDLITAATSLDHTLDLRRSLSELARVARPGAHFVVWDHALVTAGDRFRQLLYDLVRAPWGQKLAKLRANLPRERVRVYDNGIVLWAPKGYADPFHAPRSRRPSWYGLLHREIEAAGFTRQATDPDRGFSHYVRD